MDENLASQGLERGTRVGSGVPRSGTESQGRCVFRRSKETRLAAGIGDLWWWRDPAKGRTRPGVEPGRDSAMERLGKVGLGTREQKAGKTDSGAREAWHHRASCLVPRAGTGCIFGPWVPTEARLSREQGWGAMRPWGRRGLTPRAVAGRLPPLLERSSGAEPGEGGGHGRRVP